MVAMVGLGAAGIHAWTTIEDGTPDRPAPVVADAPAPERVEPAASGPEHFEAGIPAVASGPEPDPSDPESADPEEDEDVAPPPPWEAVFRSGDTLDALLARASLPASLRREIALAVAAEHDLRGLRPGHILRVGHAITGEAREVSLAVDDGVRIEVILGDGVSGRTIAPDPITAERAASTRIDGSLYASLDAVGAPPRFSVDLARVLGDAVDFRRDLKGDETVEVFWQSAVLPDGTEIGEPRLTYAALELDEDRFEVVWPEAEPGRTAVYLNGDALRTAAPPVTDARLSSAFGPRRHPVFGDMRMHTGVDYAAPEGTPVSAAAPGRVAFVGRRGGYGRVVEIAHGSDTMTRYAHLSAAAEGLAVGDRVSAGQRIGRVGQTGTATGPNLHYEVRVGGRPVDPLGDDRLDAGDSIDLAEASALLHSARRRAAAAMRDGVEATP
jgi:murein DD-endopeptidase MepM/ murein hydrolase activator NlpD